MVRRIARIATVAIAASLLLSGPVLAHPLGADVPDHAHDGQKVHCDDDPDDQYDSIGQYDHCVELARSASQTLTVYLNTHQYLNRISRIARIDEHGNPIASPVCVNNNGLQVATVQSLGRINGTNWTHTFRNSNSGTEYRRVVHYVEITVITPDECAGSFWFTVAVVEAPRSSYTPSPALTPHNPDVPTKETPHNQFDDDGWAIGSGGKLFEKRAGGVCYEYYPNEPTRIPRRFSC